jgi:type IV secretory pathway ATPase VirB11/archaellum biosynthesis ATPase
VLKSVLTELHANEAFLTATLVATGHLDVNSTPERLEVVLTEMRAELEAAGIEPPAAPAAKA